MNSCSTTLNTHFVYCYLSCLIPKNLAVPIQRVIQHWVTYHGIEWTVGRLKDLKNQYIHYLDGSKITFVASHSDGTPKGAFRPLWLESSNLVFRVLNIYTTVVLSDITTKQEKKFIDSLQLSDWNLSFPLRVDGIFLKKIQYSYGHPYVWFSHSSRRAPIVLPNNSILSMKESDMSFEDVLRSFQNPHVSSHVLAFREEYAKALWVDVSTIEESCWSPDTFTNPIVWSNRVVGKIGLIQEKGAKLRAVANPLRHIQMVLQPLGEAVFDCLRSLPWDCTFDQSKGVKFVQEALKGGQVVHSLDLSDATNTFPLKVQLEVVSAVIRQSILNPKSYGFKTGTEIDATDQHDTANLLKLVEIFAVMSRGDWGYRNTRFLKWTKGQPLGLYPSFAIFALTHGVLLRNIELKLHKSNTFRVLGDDVVITDSEVARCYREDLDYLGCVLSKDKCIISDRIAEFAGCIVDDNGVVIQGKFRTFKASDLLGPLHYLGWKGLIFVPPTLRKKIAFLASTPEPVGLGLNPKGLTPDERMPVNLIHWWFPVSKAIPNELKISHEDAKHQHRLFWNSVDFGVVPGLTGLYPIRRHFAPVFVDRQIRSVSQLIVDHVKAVNSSMLFQEDISLPCPVLPQTPNRGRVEQPTSTLRAGIKRLTILYKNFKKQVASRQ